MGDDAGQDTGRGDCRKWKTVSGRKKTAETTKDVLAFLFSAGVFAWRQNVLPVPVVRAGVVAGFRSGSKVGLPDIMGIVPAGVFLGSGGAYGVPLWVEVKTGRDKLRPEQVGAHSTARKCGAVVFVVRDFEDFKRQWDEIVVKK